MDQINDRLWISDIRDAREKTFDGDAVVTVCQDDISDNVGCDYAHFDLADGPSDSCGGRCSYELFASAVDTVVRRVSNGQEVLVHCHMGQSRSASVCIAALGVLHGMSYEEGYARVRDARTIINPDETLVRFARKFIEDHG